MKRITVLLLIFALAAALCSCGGGKPDDMSDAMYQIGKNALAVADQYIAGEITGDTAYDRLDEYYTQAEAQTEKEMTDLGVDSLYGTEFAGDAHAYLSIFTLKMVVGRAKYGDAAMSEVKEVRDSLAETIKE